MESGDNQNLTQTANGAVLPHEPSSPSLNGKGCVPPSSFQRVCLWLNYALLFIFSFSLYLSWAASLCGVAALVLGYILRSTLSKNTGPWRAHASWQVNTFWISLGVLGVATILFGISGYFALSDYDGLMERLDALSKSTSAFPQLLNEFWSIPGSRLFFGTLIAFCVVSAFWPLKRVLQGLFTLPRGLEPLHSRLTGFLAFLATSFLLVLCAMMC